MDEIVRWEYLFNCIAVDAVVFTSHVWAADFGQWDLEMIIAKPPDVVDHQEVLCGYFTYWFNTCSTSGDMEPTSPNK